MRPPKTDFLLGDNRERLAELPAGTFHVCATSPPYWNLRQYVKGDYVAMRSDLTPEQREYVISEMKKAGAW